jgi:hypothetical protein
MAAPGSSPQWAHGIYMFVLASRDTELDAHTDAVFHAMAAKNRQRVTARRMHDETTRVCEDALQWHLSGNWSIASRVYKGGQRLTERVRSVPLSPSSFDSKMTPYQLSNCPSTLFDDA